MAYDFMNPSAPPSAPNFGAPQSQPTNPADYFLGPGQKQQPGQHLAHMGGAKLGEMNSMYSGWNWANQQNSQNYNWARNYALQQQQQSQNNPNNQAAQNLMSQWLSHPNPINDQTQQAMVNRQASQLQGANANTMQNAMGEMGNAGRLDPGSMLALQQHLGQQAGAQLGNASTGLDIQRAQMQNTSMKDALSQWQSMQNSQAGQNEQYAGMMLGNLPQYQPFDPSGTYNSMNAAALAQTMKPSDPSMLSQILGPMASLGGAGLGAMGKSGGCFLTTACVEAKGLPDDCHELTVLRDLRDEMKKTEEGAALVKEYYEIAPRIVGRMTTEEAAALYDALVEPCVSLIEAGKKEAAVAHYKNVVETLQAMHSTGRSDDASLQDR
jgi:hypothetical protein